MQTSDCKQLPHNYITSFFYFVFFVFSTFPAYSDNKKDRLPNWIETNKVVAQTGLFHFTGKPKFNNVAQELKLLGVKSAYIRHIKLDWSGPLWPSKVPVGKDGKPILINQTDYLSKIVADAKEKKLKFISYYWEAGEGVPLGVDKSKLLRPHIKYNWHPPQDWYCRDLSGKLVPVSIGKYRPLRGYHLDLLSDYKYFLLERLKEMVERGVDALYFDERHLPKAQVSACYGSTIQKLYLKEGYTLPTKNNWTDPNYKKYIEFQAEKMADAFQFLINGIKQAFPTKKIPFIISGTYLASYTLPHMSLKLPSVADITKIEYLLGARDGLNGMVFRRSKTLKKPSRDIQIALGWIISRDAGDGRPVHIWHPNFTSLESIKTFIASTQAYGAITSVNIPTHYLSGERLPRVRKNKSSRPDTPYAFLREGFKFGNNITQYLSKIRPSKDIAIYLSEKQRKKYNNFEMYWRKQLWPINAAFKALVRNGLPASIITDEQIETLINSKTKLLISPAESLSNKQLKWLKEQNPELTIYLFDDKKKLSYENTHQEAFQKLSDSILKITKKVISTRVVYGGKNHSHIKPHAVFFNTADNKRLITISNDFSKFGEKGFKKPPMIKNATLRLKNKPKGVIELLTGKKLDIIRTNQGLYKVIIPNFQEIALISILK